MRRPGTASTACQQLPAGDLCPAVPGPLPVTSWLSLRGSSSLSQDGTELVVSSTYLPTVLSAQLEGQFCLRETSIDLCLNIDVPLPPERPTLAGWG